MKVEFWSSSEYSGFLVGLIRELRESGVDAEQKFHIKETTYRESKTVFARVILRCRQYLLYPVVLAGHLLWMRICGRSPDVVVVSTNTFYAPLLATFCHPRVVHLVYDLFPEALVFSRKVKAETRLARGVRWIVARTIERAYMNVFLGERLFRYVQSIHSQVPRAAVIPVGSDQTLFTESPKEREEFGEGSSPCILYCGNFGNMHDSATLSAYFGTCAEQPDTAREAIRWVFRCSGSKFRMIQNTLAGQSDSTRLNMDLRFGQLKEPEWVAAMKAADVALVTMIRGSETVVMPSKAYSAMMAGQALLVVAPEPSDLVDLVKRADCGWWVEPGDMQGFRDAVHEIATDPKGLLQKREAAFSYAHKHYGQDQLAVLWNAALLNECEHAPSEAKRIWIFNPFDDVPGEGHAQRYSTVADELARAGHEVIWWSSDFSHRRKVKRKLEPDEGSRGYALRLVKTPCYKKNISFKRIWNHSRFGVALYREALQSIYSGELLPPDIILASSPPLEGPVAAMKLKKRFHCQVITDVMDRWPSTLISAFPQWARPFGQVFLLPYYRMLSRACCESDLISAQSESYADFAMKHGAKTQPYVCYLGATAPVGVHAKVSPSRGLRLLYLGAMGWSYDLETILDAIELLHAQGIIVECVMVGDGEKRSILEARNVPGVRFTGYLHGQDLAAELVSADLGIIPFFPDSGVAVPYKAADYLAYGLPLLSTIDGELGTLIRKHECGMVYEAGNSKSLAMAVRQYSEEPKLLHQSKVGTQACFLEQFDREQTYPDFADWITSTN